MTGDKVESDFTDPECLSDLLCELESTATVVERWVVIQHASFDYEIDSGPYHAAQGLADGIELSAPLICTKPPQYFLSMQGDPYRLGKYFVIFIRAKGSGKGSRGWRIQLFLT